MKYVYLKTFRWSEKFKEVKGSYYDYVAEILAFSKEREDSIRNDLLNQGFREIKTNNGILVFEKARHIVRIFCLYEKNS